MTERLTASDNVPKTRADLSELRKEADGVKQCFTQFSFQALIFSSAALGVIIQVGHNDTSRGVNFAALLVVVLILAVARIGTYKYATANRIYGFQLFIERLSHMSPDVRTRLTEARLDIGWEEAMRAWRIVQASVFEVLYETKRVGWRKILDKARIFRTINTPTPRHDLAVNDGSAWWSVESLTADTFLSDEKGGNVHVSYHGGSYLSTILNVLYVFVAAAFFPPIIALFTFLSAAFRANQLKGYIEFVAFFVLTAGFAVYSVHNCLFINRRRKLLETGLLSIHSCSIMWEAVAVAHQRAVRGHIGKHMTGYSMRVADQARLLLKGDWLENIHDWFDPINADYGCEPKRRAQAAK